MLSTFALVLAAANAAFAHFSIEYPTWRADSLENSNYSQYVFPCAGVPFGAWSDNRTDWPVTGGSLKLDLHHPWTYVFVNLGLGENITNFNYTLTPSFWNETGNGTLCIPHLPLPVGLSPEDGQHATLQVVTLGAAGQALYNCADITFRSNASDLQTGECTTSPGVSFTLVTQEVNGSTTATSTTTASSPGTTSAAGPVNETRLALLFSMAALAVLFAGSAL